MSEVVPVDLSIEPKFDYSKITLPENVAMTFRLASHMTALDLPEHVELDRIVREADIVVPEYVTDPDTKEKLPLVAAGNTRAYQALRSTLQGSMIEAWSKPLYSSLFNSRTAIANIDIDVNHAAVAAFLEAQEVLLRENRREVRTVAERVVPHLLKMYEAVMRRDQVILENVSPEIEKVIAADRFLPKKRTERPLNALLFYGTFHRSLPDALRYKSELEPVSGFSVSVSDDSIGFEPQFAPYAKYIRGQEVTIEDLELFFAFTMFGAVLERKGYLGEQFSGEAVSRAFADHLSELDTTDMDVLIEQTKAIYE